MTEPPQDKTPPAGQPAQEPGQSPSPDSRDMIDLLIAISVVARHLAKRIEEASPTKDQGAKPHEQNE